MSKPCACGKSRTLQGCEPCYRLHIQAKNRGSYWRNVAPFKSRTRGRPRKHEKRIVGGPNRTALRFLSMPLRSAEHAVCKQAFTISKPKVAKQQWKEGNA